MAIFHIVDQHLVSDTEYTARAADITNHLTQRVAAKSLIQPLALSMGRELAAVAPVAAPPSNNFTDIGQGLPLSVTIQYVYTGKYPERAIFGHRGDMAIVSGVKNFSQFDATARAVNYLEPSVAPNTRFTAPTAFNQGTPLVLYSPAVTDPALTVTFEMAFANDFVSQLLGEIAGGVQSLAGVPIMLPYAGYLLGASSLLKLGEGVADALYQDQPAFLNTEVLNFGLPGQRAVADWRFVCNSSFDTTPYSFDYKNGLVDKNGAAYAGDEPYIVIAVDGTQHDGWRGFTPAVASASITQKFFNLKDGAQTSIDTVVGAIGVYSDFKYRQQADKLEAQITANPQPTNVSDLQKQYNAIVANINDPSMKPK